MKRSPVIVILVAVLALVALQQSAFIVDQTETALVLQLGKPVRGAQAPGLHFKLPFVQNIIFFDARLLNYDAQPSEVLTKDKKTMEVDNYSKWRIADPLKFYTTVRSIRAPRPAWTISSIRRCVWRLVSTRLSRSFRPSVRKSWSR